MNEKKVHQYWIIEMKIPNESLNPINAMGC